MRTRTACSPDLCALPGCGSAPHPEQRAGCSEAPERSPLLRWALFEAAQCAARPGSPDYACYRRVADRIGGGRATLSVARKMVRRAHHTLRALGDEALAPV